MVHLDPIMEYTGQMTTNFVPIDTLNGLISEDNVVEWAIYSMSRALPEDADYYSLVTCLERTVNVDLPAWEIIAEATQEAHYFAEDATEEYISRSKRIGAYNNLMVVREIISQLTIAIADTGCEAPEFIETLEGTDVDEVAERSTDETG